MALGTPPSRGQLLGKEAMFGKGPMCLQWREVAPCGFRLFDDSRWVVALQGGGVSLGWLSGHTSRVIEGTVMAAAFQGS